ncbi:MAG: hypothetical protein P1P67_05030 [Treponema phagedenis]|uniref:hypothetical protein n=1 Tax=Treponema phagedenis TaxID=162 RepID=UPI003133DF3C
MARVMRKLELARVGKWGKNSDEITEKDLRDAVETFAGRMPVSIGHDAMYRDNAPKFGDILSVELSDDGKTLAGEVEFSKELDILYRDGKYDGWSVSLPRRAKDGKTYLHHLAFTGATPPKIPGLKELKTFQFADGDKVSTFEFSGKLKEIDGEVNMELTTEEIKALQEKAERLERELATLKAENEKLSAEKKELEEKLKSASADSGSEADQNLPKEFSDKLNALGEELKKNRLSVFNAKLAGKVPKGIAEKAGVLASSLAARNDAVNFSDNGKPTSANEIELFGDILSAWPEQVAEGSAGFDYSDNLSGGQGEKKESVAAMAARMIKHL